MSKKISTKIPSYRLHKSSGLAVVRLNGRDFYLGKHGSPESKNKYNRLISEWLTNNQQIPIDNVSTPPVDLTVNELFLAYWQYAESYYRKNGVPTSEQGLIKLAVRPLVDLYGTTPAENIGPLALKTVRQMRMLMEKNVGKLPGYLRDLRIVQEAQRWVLVVSSEGSVIRYFKRQMLRS